MANLINIVVLTRKDMISPTNVVLTGLAIADLAVLLEYIPYTLHTYLRPTTHSVKDRYTYGWAMLVLWHSNFSQVFHTISIWLTVVLAVWRYIAVAYPQKNRDWCNMDTTYRAAGWKWVPDQESHHWYQYHRLCGYHERNSQTEFHQGFEFLDIQRIVQADAVGSADCVEPQ
ncbi:G-protein coupled receptor, partial [Sarracenia purpurea var. burkii]